MRTEDSIHRALILILILVLALLCRPARGNSPNITDPVLAAKLGLTVQQIHTIESSLGWTDADLLAMSPVQLQTIAFDLDHPGIDKHLEALKFRALKMMDEHGKIPPAGLLHALEQRRHMTDDGDLQPLPPGSNGPGTNTSSPGPFTAGIGTNGWTWLGPGNIGGRVRSILVHPTLTNILWCGGVDGGVWKTTNSGAAWFPLNDFMPNLAVSCLAMDPLKPDVIYAGTGEGMYNQDAVTGGGLFRTSDGGNTWSQVAAFQYINRIAVDPNNDQVMLVATRSGVYRTSDGWATWALRTGTEMLDIAFHPTNSSLAVCSGWNGKAFYSTDGGQSWTVATGLPAPAGFIKGRVELAYSPSMPSMVFASVDNNSGELYVSADGGHTYSFRNTGTSYLDGQGWYGNTIWCDPTTTNILVVGGIDLWRSTDGGATLTKISQWQSAPASSAHADHHVIVASPAFDGVNVRMVYFGNDGGVYRAADVYNVGQTFGWQNLNNNLGITQFYGGAGNTNTSVIVGGTQDNGTLRYTTGGGQEGWTSMFGGDGGFAAADQSNPSYFYGEYVYLQIHRSSNGGQSSSYIYSGISDAGNGNTANFIAPFILDPNNFNTMLAGGASLWRSTNVKATTPSWTAIKSSIGSQISAIAVAPGNSSVIWVGHNNGAVYYTTNGTATTPTWYSVSGGLPQRFCERIAINPTNSSKVYLAFGGFNPSNLWRTTNGGLNWSNITANLPAAPINSIVIAPGDPNTLFVGTEVGVFGSSNDGGTWSTGNDGPANVNVDELFWLGNKLVAVTHGRGMYSTIPALGPPTLAPAGAVVSAGNNNGWLDPNECNRLSLPVLNIGGGLASNITAVLSSTTPGVTVLQANSSYPDLAANVTGTNTVPFQIYTDPSFPCGSPVSVSLTLTFSATTNTVSFVLPSASAVFAITPSSGASIVSGTNDIGNHGDDVLTTIALPFTYFIYGQAFTNATVSANGNLQFFSADNAFNNLCLPYSGFNYAILPFWDDLRTDTPGSGIFTLLAGTAPNRVFYLEWRATYFNTGAPVDFELALYENQPRFDVIYGALNGSGTNATVGVQKDSKTYTSFECNSGAGVVSNGLQLTFQQTCTSGGGACPAAVASFSSSPTNGAVPLLVSFVNSSTGAVGYNWDFGDGKSSAAASPNNLFTNAGSYTVTLSAYGGGVTNVATATILVTNVPPAIVSQPQGVTTNIGVTVAFAVNATGTLPLSYEWRLGGVAISGATNSSYLRTNVQCADAGPFDVVITNAGGSLTSSIAPLVVIAPPVITLQPTNLVVNIGTTAAFVADATNDCGNSLTYQWCLGGTNLAGATNATLVRSNAQPPDAGNYTVVVTNLAGSTTSAVATLTVIVPPTIGSEPANLTVASGSNATFTVTATGYPPFSYQWREAGTPILDASASSYTRTNAQCVDAGAFDVIVGNSAGNVTSSVAVLTVVAPPTIISNPSPQTVIEGQNAVFGALATNDCGGGLVYQWLFAGTNLSDATNNVLTLSNSQPANAGDYAVVVTNLAGSVTSTVATLTVLVPPAISAGPGSLMTAQGSNAVFSVHATGTLPLSYQWRESGSDIAAGTDSAYTRTNAQCADAGGFDVVITNLAGSITSIVAVLTVVAPPGIATNPVSLTVIMGQLATFSVEATNACGEGFAYQWEFGGTNLTYATNAVLTFSNTQPADAGAYTVVVTNIAGAVTSTVATLTVLVPPAIAAGPASLTVARGSNANFEVSATGSTPLSYQWRESGVPVATATDSAYTRTNAQCSDFAGFDVVVTNSAGSITSTIALLEVVSPPLITTEPAGETIAVGTTAILSVVATNDCGGGISYQWLLTGTNLAGATNAVFVRTNAQFSDSGSYSVLVTNLAGAVTSAPAMLIVTNPPQLVVTPALLNFGLIATGATAEASFAVSNAGPLALSGSATVTAGPYTLGGTNSTVLAVPAFATTNLVVAFSPLSPGSFSNAFAFNTDGGDSTNLLLGQSLSASPPVLLWPSQIGNEFVFYFLTDPTKTYVVQFKDALDAPVWFDLQTNSGDGRLKSVTNPLPAAPQQFYRLKAE